MIKSELHTAMIAQQHQRIHRNTSGVCVKLRDEKLASLELDTITIHIATAFQLGVDYRGQHVHRLR